MSISFSASYAALWVLVVFQGVILVALLAQLAELRRLIERGTNDAQLPAGTIAPEFVVFDEADMAQVTEQTFAGQGGVLLFLSPECSVCVSLAENIGQNSDKSLPQIIAFCSGVDSACSKIGRRLGRAARFVLQKAAETAALYHVSGFPTAVLVDPDLQIRGYGHPKDVDDLKQFIARNLRLSPHGSSGANHLTTALANASDHQ